MSLLGRLEDLSLTDIIQIVFLSRRTGVLEIIDERGRHTVLFRQGLLANASAPDSPDLASYLVSEEHIPASALRAIRNAEEAGVPAGSAVLEMNLMPAEALGKAIQERIQSIVAPLLQSRDGEFNFILSESIGPLDAEYEPEVLFKEGGITPQKILGGEGEKIKPLKGLEESMRAGKALLRGDTPTPPATGSLDLPLGIMRDTPPATAPEPPLKPAGPLGTAEAEATVVPFPAKSGNPFDAVYDDVAASESLESLLAEPKSPAPAPPPVASPAPPAAETPEVPAAAPPAETAAEEAKPVPSRFKVTGAGREAVKRDRNVVVFERNPLVRVAAKRAFTKRGVQIFQFGSMEETWRAIGELLRDNQFFVTFVDLTEADRAEEGDSTRLLQSIKKKNRHLPVVLVDSEEDSHRRHRFMKEGADLYLTKPTQERMHPGVAEEELVIFADEMVLFAQKAFSDWEQIAGTFDDESDVGKQFYDIARKERMNRSLAVLRQFINELSSPDDIMQVAQMILHLAAEYLERGALFLVEAKAFSGVAGFGATGTPEEMTSRVQRVRLNRGEPSVFVDVLEHRKGHQGKIRRSPANFELINGLGRVQPTEVIVLPIRHENEVVGLLYGDNAEHKVPIDDTSGLEIFLDQAGFAFSTAARARRKQRLEREER